MDPQEIRDAATVILVRRDGPEPRVLMGQRGAAAAFMPSKFVFPGGRVDPADAEVDLQPGLQSECRRRLLVDATISPEALAAAAIRELREETGLSLARVGSAVGSIPAGWASFYEQGLTPSADALTFMFRAVTPPGRPRRFDARFFLAEASGLLGDPEDFGAADGELAHLSWLAIADARALDLPFVTRVVLAELEDRLNDSQANRPVPYFRHGAEVSEVLTL